jgi:hypothetical protein
LDVDGEVGGRSGASVDTLHEPGGMVFSPRVVVHPEVARDGERESVAAHARGREPPGVLEVPHGRVERGAIKFIGDELANVG